MIKRGTIHVKAEFNDSKPKKLAQNIYANFLILCYPSLSELSLKCRLDVEIVYINAGVL